MTSKLAWTVGLAATLGIVATATIGAAQGNDVCVRLEAQLAEIDHALQAPSARMAEFDQAIDNRRRHLGVALAQRRSAGCDRRGFLFFRGSRSAGCEALEARIRTLENDLYRLEDGRARAAPRMGGRDREMRGRILAALSEHGCTGQDPSRSAWGGNRLFGALYDDRMREDDDDRYGGHGGFRVDPSGTYRTLCVRACDGYFWPISFSAASSQFDRDAQACRASCTGTEVTLFVHRNPGEGPEEAVSLAGARYSELPNAFRFRDEYNPGCTCGAQDRFVARVRSAIDASAEPDEAATPEPEPPAVVEAPPPSEQPDGRSTDAEPDTLPRRPREGVRIVGPETPYYRPGDS